MAEIFKQTFVDQTYLRKDDNYEKGETGEQNIDTTGTVYLLNGVPTGTDWETRVGRRILMTSLTIRGYFYGAPQSLRSKNRVCILYDKQTRNAAPAIGDIFDGSFPSANFNRYKALQRFDVLYDKTFVTLGQGKGTPITWLTEISCIPWEVTIPLNHYATFTGTGATVASMDFGALWLVLYGDQVAGNTAAFFNGSYIVTFVDK